MSGITSLSRVLVQQTFLFMKGPELAIASCVSKQWNHWIGEDVIWNKLFAREFPNDHLLESEQEKTTPKRRFQVKYEQGKLEALKKKLSPLFGAIVSGNFQEKMDNDRLIQGFPVSFGIDANGKVSFKKAIGNYIMARLKLEVYPSVKPSSVTLTCDPDYVLQNRGSRFCDLNTPPSDGVNGISAEDFKLMKQNITAFADQLNQDIKTIICKMVCLNKQAFDKINLDDVDGFVYFENEGVLLTSDGIPNCEGWTRFTKRDFRKDSQEKIAKRPILSLLRRAVAYQTLEALRQYDAVKK